MVQGITRYCKWTITDWSVQHGLLILNLVRFVLAKSDTRRSVQSSHFRASCNFVKARRICFSRFVGGPEAVILDISNTRFDSESEAYRFFLRNGSSLEIVANECSTIEW